jgi:hypothetical protein
MSDFLSKLNAIDKISNSIRANIMNINYTHTISTDTYRNTVDLFPWKNESILSSCRRFYLPEIVIKLDLDDREYNKQIDRVLYRQ